MFLSKISSSDSSHSDYDIHSSIQFPPCISSALILITVLRRSESENLEWMEGIQIATESGLGMFDHCRSQLALCRAWISIYQSLADCHFVHIRAEHHEYFLYFLFEVII